jgi:hypothetical protein
MRVDLRITARRCYILSVVALVIAEVPVGAAPVTYHTVALSGQVAPGAGLGAFYSTFGKPNLNNTGQVGYTALLSGPQVTADNDAVVYAGNLAQPRLIAREGDSAPVTSPGVKYSSFLQFIPPALNDTGLVAFGASLTGIGVTTNNDYATFTRGAAEAEVVAREGDIAPGPDTTMRYWFLGTVALNASGHVGYFAEVTPNAGVTQYDAIYAGKAGAPELVAREGDKAPGTNENVTYRRFQGINFNDGDGVAYVSEFRGIDITMDNGAGVYAGNVHDPLLVARLGDPAPGAGSGVVYKEFPYDARINNSGRLLYGAFISGTGSLANAKYAALYAGTIGAPQLIVRHGNPAPGGAPGEYFFSYLSLGGPTQNEAGQVAFRFQTSEFNIGIWAGSPAALQLVALTGRQAPGSDPGVLYSALGRPALNDAGQVAYTASFAGAGVTELNDFGLFVFDPLFGNVLVAREGQLFDVGTGELRTILGILAYSTDYDDSRSGFSNDGRLAFTLTFTDGTSGVFVATIPEPAGIALLCGANAILVGARRWKRRRPTPRNGRRGGGGGGGAGGGDLGGGSARR